MSEFEILSVEHYKDGAVDKAPLPEAKQKRRSTRAIKRINYALLKKVVDDGALDQRKKEYLRYRERKWRKRKKESDLPKEVPENFEVKFEDFAVDETQHKKCEPKKQNPPLLLADKTNSRQKRSAESTRRSTRTRKQINYDERKVINDEEIILCKKELSNESEENFFISQCSETKVENIENEDDRVAEEKVYDVLNENTKVGAILRNNKSFESSPIY